MCRWFDSALGHQFQKPEPVSGFFTSGRGASSGGPSPICLASVIPPMSAFLALFGLSVLHFYLDASRALHSALRPTHFCAICGRQPERSRLFWMLGVDDELGVSLPGAKQFLDEAVVVDRLT